MSLIDANLTRYGDMIPRNTQWTFTVNVSLSSTSSSVNYAKFEFSSEYSFSGVSLDGAFSYGSVNNLPSGVEINGFTMNPGGEGGVSFRGINTSRLEGIDSVRVLLVGGVDTLVSYVKFIVIREDTTVPLIFFHKSLGEKPHLLNRQVRVRGVVSAVIGSKTYIQDSLRDTIGGLVIYGSLSAYPGEYIKVSGTFSPYRGLEEIINPVLESREYVGIPDPVYVDRLTRARELFSGVLIRIDSVKIPDTLTFVPVSTNIGITDRYGNSGYMFVDRYTGMEGFPPPDTIFNLVGVVDEDSSSSGNIYRIIPRGPGDILFYSSVYVDKVIPYFSTKGTPTSWKIPLSSVNPIAKLMACLDTNDMSITELSSMRFGTRAPDTLFLVADTVCARFNGIYTNHDTLYINTEGKTVDSIVIFLYSAPDTMANFRRAVYVPRLYFVTPIKDIQARAPGEYSSQLEGQSVFTGGVVMVDVGKFSTTSTSTYIYDGTAGVNIYSSTPVGLKEGNVVLVGGTVSEYNGLTEVVFTSIRIIGNDTLPQPLKLNPGIYLNEDLEGSLVRVDTVVVSSLPMYAGVGKSFTVQNGAASITVYVYPSTGINLSNINLGDYLSIKGIVGQYSTSYPYNTGYQLLPRKVEDVVKLVDNFVSDKLNVDIKNNVFVPSSGEVSTIDVSGPEGLYDAKIYDSGGRLVKVLVEGKRNGGRFTWDGKNEKGMMMPPGVYVLYVGVKSDRGYMLRKVKPVVIGVK